MMTTAWVRSICLFWLLVIPFSGNAVTPMIAAGSNSALFLNADGSVWGTGNVTGYWGATSPVRLLTLPNVVSIATNGGNSDIALLANGTVWVSGNGMGGQLGDGSTQYRSLPQQVPGLSDIKDVKSAGHVLALRRDGTVWAWGPNQSGQLGDGTKVDRYSPVQVSGLTNVVEISAAPGASLARTADGSVWVWGFVCCGDAGDGRGAPTEADRYRLVPSRVLNLDQVVAITAGPEHKMALRADGTVWTWGRGDEGQNGTEDFRNLNLPILIPGLSDVVAIAAAGMRFSVALKVDGTVWAWGNSNAGQVGISGITYSAVPLRVPGVTDVITIAAGSDYVLAMRRDGTVYAWGANGNGQLGDGSVQSRPEPLLILGPGGGGQLNLVQLPPAHPNQLPSALVRFSPVSGHAPLSVSFNVVSATDPDGTVKAYYWQSSDGQQATGTSPMFVFPHQGTYNVVLLVEDSAGGRGSNSFQVVVTGPVGVVTARPKALVEYFKGMALANDGRILTWGLCYWLASTSCGRPASSPIIPIPGANGVTTAVDFSQAAGGSVTHVLMADGTVMGWGTNNSGQLGIGSQVNVTGQPSTLPNLPPVQSLAAGGDHVLALTRDGRVFAWGRNAEGQLGLGDSENRNSPAEISGLSQVVAVAAGIRFSMALTNDGTVWVWGDNCCFQLGDGTLTSRNRPIQAPGLAAVQNIFAGGNNAFAIKSDGTVWASGFLPFPVPGESQPPSSSRRVAMLEGYAQLATGTQHIIGRKADGTVWVVGRRQSGALGVVGNNDIQVPQPVPGVTEAIWVGASVGNSTVLRRDGTVLAWGDNSFGQVGDGTLATRVMPVIVVNETADGPLDLVPEVPNTISPDYVPSFFVVTAKSGELQSTSLSVDVKGPARTSPGTFAAGYNVYVAASVPIGNTFSWYQMDTGRNWSGLTWPMPEYLRGVALDSQNSVITTQILQNTDLRSLIGTTLYIGYGLDADEMLRTNRYRDIFTVTQTQ